MSDESFSFTDLAIGLVAIAVALFAVFVVPRFTKEAKAKRVVVNEFEKALLIVKGRIERELGPGQYSTWLTTNTIERYDVREASMHIAGQELLTKDFMPIKLTVIARYRISDPRAYRSASLQPGTRMYENIQIELRKRVSAVSFDELMADREKLTAGFVEAVAPDLKSVGLDLLGIELRDLIPSGPAKQAYADIWKAQKDGQAALERARAEQASLRSLANAARMLKGNPELMNLRVLQALAGGPGKPTPTVVLGGGAGLLPVSATPDTGGDTDA